jgi:hypothetical protein
MSNISLTPGATVSTKDASAVVTLGSPAVAGSNLRFSLVVVDNYGNTSQPAFVDIAVQALPVAVIRTGATNVSPGTNISLDGSLSTPPGTLTTYRWTLVSVTAPDAPTPVPRPTPIPIPPRPIASEDPVQDPKASGRSILDAAD